MRLASPESGGQRHGLRTNQLNQGRFGVSDELYILHEMASVCSKTVMAERGILLSRTDLPPQVCTSTTKPATPVCKGKRIDAPNMEKRGLS